MRGWGACLTFAAALLAAATARSGDADCRYAPPRPASLAPSSAVSDYAPVLEACRARDGEARLALRRFRLGGETLLLLADADALTTRIERAACWRCEPVDEASLAGTRLMRAVAASAEAPGIAHRSFLEDAGLTYGVGQGAYVTGDLCPSFRPLDRGFFMRLEQAGTPAPAPAALSISGLWLVHHAEDFRWLVAERDAGRLDIVWVDHSYHHPYRRGAPDGETFLMTPGVDPQEEILDTERLLIANGETPSLFFRFPGLVSSSPLMQTVRADHLIALGADAWLAEGQRTTPGSIILVHPNGNEPQGIALFERALSRGALPRPFAPLTDAPR